MSTAESRTSDTLVEATATMLERLREPIAAGDYHAAARELAALLGPNDQHLRELLKQALVHIALSCDPDVIKVKHPELWDEVFKAMLRTRRSLAYEVALETQGHQLVDAIMAEVRFTDEREHGKGGVP